MYAVELVSTSKRIGLTVASVATLARLDRFVSRAIVWRLAPQPHPLPVQEAASTSKKTTSTVEDAASLVQEESNATTEHVRVLRVGLLVMAFVSIRKQIPVTVEPAEKHAPPVRFVRQEHASSSAHPIHQRYAPMRV